MRNGLLPAEPQHATYATLGQFARYVLDVSKSIRNEPGYEGVKIYERENGFRLIDAPSSGDALSDPLKIQFQDLVGQPTWLSPQTISFKTVMRGDLKPGDVIEMPKGPQIQTATSFLAYRNRATFTGIFQIYSARHIGSYKQTGGDAWVSVFEAKVMQP